MFIVGQFPSLDWDVILCGFEGRIICMESQLSTKLFAQVTFILFRAELNFHVIYVCVCRPYANSTIVFCPFTQFSSRDEILVILSSDLVDQPVQDFPTCIVRLWLVWLCKDGFVCHLVNLMINNVIPYLGPIDGADFTDPHYS